MYKHHLSPREIEKMKKNMKKVPVIQLKTEIYHNKEIDEADKILKSIPPNTPQQTTSQIEANNYLPWYKKIWHYIYNSFTSSP
ncbi:MAG: hypothetical protein WCL18_02315 [bacterium]